MVAYIVDVVILRLAVFGALSDDADVRLALRSRSERSRVRQNRLQELQRNDFFAFKIIGSMEVMPTFSSTFK